MIGLGGALFTSPLNADDQRGRDEFDGNDFVYAQPCPIYAVAYKVDDETLGWRTPWWPGGSSLDMGMDGFGTDLPMTQNVWWAAFWETSGSPARRVYTGLSLDQYGSATPNCTVRCLRKSTNEVVGQVTSDANGVYSVGTPYDDAHIIIVHTPDGLSGGASADNIIPI